LNGGGSIQKLMAIDDWRMIACDASLSHEGNHHFHSGNKLNQMKVEITSVNCCIPLTETQWNVLRRKEDAHDNRTHGNYVFLPTTWDFPNKEKITKWEWNGHFGRNIFFTAEVGAEKNVLTFLQKYLR
jgi:hypothetical protein